MSRIEESLYNSVKKYGVRVDENINKPSRRSRLTEDLIDDFYDTFDPDGDHESGLMAHDGAELDAWINWLDDHGMDYEMEYSDDPDYEAYVIINESVKPRHRKYLNESDYDYEITNKGYTKDDIKKVKSQIANKRVLYTAKPGEGFVTKLRKEHPNYTIISRENAEKINRIDLHSVNGLILDGIEKFPNKVMGKLLTIINETPIPVLAVTYNKDELDQAVISSFRFGGVRVGESYHMPLDEKANPANAEVNAIIRKYMKRRGTPTKKEQAILDKYGIRYDKESKQFFGPNHVQVAGGTNTFAKFKPGDWMADDELTKDEIDFANMLTKPRNKNIDDRDLVWNMQKSSQGVKHYKQQLEMHKHDLERLMQRYEEAVEENDQHDIDFYAERIGEAEETIDWYQKMIDYTMMFARQDHGKNVNESLRRKMNEEVLSDWEANLSEQDRFLYDGITNRLEDAIVAWMKFTRDAEGMTDSEVRNAAAVFLTTEAHNLDLY